jgi:membrane-bound lytic murein transglycosylase B
VPPVGVAVANLQLDTISAQFLADVEAEVGSAQAAVNLSQLALAKAQSADEAASTVLTADAAQLEELNAAQRQAATSVQTARARLREFAVDAYVSGGPGAPIQALLSAGNINDFARRQGYLNTVAAESTDALRSYVQARSATSRATLVTVNALQRAHDAKQTDDLALEAAQADLATKTTALHDRESLLTLTGDAISSPGTDVPRMVLDAYQRAAAAVQAKGCHLAWWGLAAIGKIESDHGRAESARLAPNGDLVPHIVGVPLTGQNGTALIEDQGGFAHAEGPMQFIPSTWAKWAQDGNGDGVKDIDNIYDATLGAAMYLCATTTQLETDLGLAAAYFSYNHSTDYVAEALAYAKAYESADAAGLVPKMGLVPLWALAPRTAASPGGTAATASTTSTTAPGGVTPTAGH